MYSSANIQLAGKLRVCLKEADSVVSYFRAQYGNCGWVAKRHLNCPFTTSAQFDEMFKCFSQTYWMAAIRKSRIMHQYQMGIALEIPVWQDQEYETH